ncbi:alkaline phosphatase [Aestuariibacter salexigens]|uniref:alkaline phosphatase n=1 Tax=Aestuariibacter salexigens TaxID=226010 RepID=UPI000402DC74|nr:alkaline phosphatase [Aestuariibacter salexigens]
MKRIAAVVACLASLSSVAAEAPKNIIMIVSDGMGPAYTSAYRYYADTNIDDGIDETVFDRHLVGMASTYPAAESGLVTDSAAGATALSAAVKTYNGAIALDVDKQPVLTVLNYAREKGMKTGIAVTSQIVHATPAAYVAHNVSRRNYNDIADSFFDDRINGKFKLDVMLGGGTQYFDRKDRNLVDGFKQAGYQYTTDIDELTSLPTDAPILGLFGETGMAPALDDVPGRLKIMAENATKRLANDNGYFLLIEASQVDWAGHANDIASAMAEMHDLAITMEWLETYVQQHPDTLVVLTADHSTGGLTIAANGEYKWDPQWITSMKGSLRALSENFSASQDRVSLVESYFGFELNDEEKDHVAEIEATAPRDIYDELKEIIDERTNTGWTTSGHTGVDVQIFALGKGAEHFSGHLDNTDIARRIFTLLGNKNYQ